MLFVIAMFFIIMLMMIIFPLGVILGLLGLSLDMLSVALKMVVRYALPAIILAVVVVVVIMLVAKDKNAGAKISLAAAAVICVAQIGIVVFTYGINNDFVMPETENITKMEFVSTEFSTQHPDAVVWETSNWKYNVDCIGILTEYIEDGQFKRAFRETVGYIDPDEDYPYVVMTGENGKDLGTIVFYSQELIGFEQGDGEIQYYKVGSDRAGEETDPVTQVYRDYIYALGEEIWQDFAQQILDSITCEGCEIVFTIPDTDPPGEYRIYTDIMRSRKKENGGGIETWEVSTDYDEQETQQWEPGKQYSIIIGEEDTFSRFDIGVSADGYYARRDIISLLPDANVLNSNNYMNR